jgi:hypothetical protein
MVGLSDQDARDIEELERESRRPRGGTGGGNVDEVLTLDLSEAGRIGVIWPEGKYPLEITSVEKKASQPRFDEKTQTMREGGVPYVELELTCIGGDLLHEKLQDRLMLAGKGLSRFVVFADAIDMYNKDSKSFTGRLGDFLGQQVWAAVVTERTEFKGRPRERSIIDFAGYEPISAYPVPGADDGDEDDLEELEQAQESLTAARSQGTRPLRTIMAETEAEEEELDETLMAPPTPVEPPRARRATAAAAGSPGGQPPWPKRQTA